MRSVQTVMRLGKLWMAEADLGDFRVRAVLIPGKERVVIWDTLSHPDDMQVFLPMISGREQVIVYSHADWDHVWGTAGLAHRHTAIVAHELCRERFAAEVPAVLAEKIAEDPARWQAVQLFPPTVTFADRYAIRLGSTEFFLHYLPGHTGDSIVGFLPEDGVLLAGDAVETPLPQVPAGSDLVRWIEELRRWRMDRLVKTVIPAHGAIGGTELIAKNIAYLEHLQRGEEPAMPETLDDFYRETHRENVLIWCGK